MDKSWQLCIVDREACDFSEAPKFEQVFRTAARLDAFPNGTILFAVTSLFKPFGELSPIFSELQVIPKFAFIGGVMFSYVWSPEIKSYGWLMQEILRPVLTERDAIEMETKFGIDLREFVS